MSGEQLSFIKLIVNDLEAISEFYKKALGYKETMRLRVQSGLDGRMLDEIILGGSPSQLSLILVSYGEPPQPRSEVILGLSTPDLNAFIAKAKAAGGSVLAEPYSPAQGNGTMRIAFIGDPEGHAIEVIEGS